ncbi:hypothetical protein G6F63_013951 [Rhizopus arrhizus]|nr:hypothetical protein G6F63_013951 [Rhizopus arrhizus]
MAPVMDVMDQAAMLNAHAAGRLRFHRRIGRDDVAGDRHSGVLAQRIAARAGPGEPSGVAVERERDPAVRTALDSESAPTRAIRAGARKQCDHRAGRRAAGLVADRLHRTALDLTRAVQRLYRRRRQPGRRGAAGADAQGRAGSGGHCRRLGQRRIHGAGHRA